MMPVSLEPRHVWAHRARVARLPGRTPTRAPRVLSEDERSLRVRSFLIAAAEQSQGRVSHATHVEATQGV